MLSFFSILQSTYCLTHLFLSCCTYINVSSLLDMKYIALVFLALCTLKVFLERKRKIKRDYLYHWSKFDVIHFWDLVCFWPNYVFFSIHRLNTSYKTPNVSRGFLSLSQIKKGRVEARRSLLFLSKFKLPLGKQSKLLNTAWICKLKEGACILFSPS